MSFGENILKYKDDILKDLATLAELESVADYNPGECKKALDFVLERDATAKMFEKFRKKSHAQSVIDTNKRNRLKSSSKRRKFVKRVGKKHNG